MDIERKNFYDKIIRTIGKYGRIHRDYLEEQNPMIFNNLFLIGQFWTYLADLNERVQNRLQRIIVQMQKVTSSLFNA